MKGLPGTSQLLSLGFTTLAKLEPKIFGLSHEQPMDFMQVLVRETRATCMFLADSGEEDALA